MISVNRRAEKRCVDALLSDVNIRRIYSSTKIFQGYAAPNTLGTLNEFVLLQRISAVTLDRATDGTITDTLRRVRLQVDVSDTDYGKMVIRSELVRSVLERAFPSCVDDDTYGTISAGQKIFNVCSIDIILTESEV